MNLRVLAALLLLWSGIAAASVNYTNCMTLSPSYGYNLLWTIVDDTIYLQAEIVPIDSTGSWIGFGISLASAADQMIANGACSDMYINGAGVTPSCPSVSGTTNVLNIGSGNCADDLFVCQKPPSGDNGDYLLSNFRDTLQSWVTTSVTYNSTYHAVEFNRLLNDNDPQDRPFTPGTPQTIIWALGSAASSDYLKHLPDSRGYLLIDFGQPSNCTYINDGSGVPKYVGGTVSPTTVSTPAPSNVVAYTGFINILPDYSFSYAIDTSVTYVTISVTAQTDGWIGVAFTSSVSMQNADFAFAYLDQNGNAKFYDGYGQTTHQQPAVDTDIGGTNDITAVSLNSTTYQGATYLTFEFTRKLVTGDSKDFPILQAATTYVLAAHGVVSDGVPQQHIEYTGVAINLFTNNATSSGSQAISLPLHALFMLIAWGICIPTGILTAYRFKSVVVWFPVHVSFQITAALLSVIGASIIGAYIGFFNVTSHGSLGVAVLACMALQICFGIISDRVESARAVVGVLHRWFGRIVFACAIANLFLGLQQINVGIAPYALLAVWLGVFAVIMTILVIEKSFLSVNAGVVSLSNKEMEIDENKHPESPIPVWIKVLVAVWLVVAIALIVAIIVLLFKAALAPVSNASSSKSDSSSSASPLQYNPFNGYKTASPDSASPTSSPTSNEPTSVAPNLILNFVNYSIPQEATTYACQTFIFNSGPHDVIRFSPIEDNKQCLHHMILYQVASDPGMGSGVWLCPSMPNTATPLWLWALGGSDFILPPGIGARIGTGYAVYTVLQVHFDLSWSSSLSTTFEVDSSGVALYYASALQPNRMATLRLGQPLSNGNGGGIYTGPDNTFALPPGVSNFTTTPECPSSTTSILPYNLNVFAWAPHMHHYGSYISLAQIRAGKQIGFWVNPRWDFNNQQIYYTNTIIQASDALQTTCVWNTVGAPGTIYGGEASTNEMCFNFFFYYPPLPNNIDSCNA